MHELVVQTHGCPNHEMSLQLIGARDRILATGIIPASAFPTTETFREGHIANGVVYEVERLGDNVWDVWLNLPPDPWLGWMVAERDAKASIEIVERLLREARKDWPPPGSPRANRKPISAGKKN